MFAHPRMFLIRFLSLMMALVAALLTASSVHAQQAFFTGLGHLPGDNFGPTVLSVISADGSTVAGYSSSSYSSNAPQRPFRWTHETGMVDLGSLPGYAQGVPMNISADGSSIVGTFSNYLTNTTDVFRWTGQSGLVSLTTFDTTSLPAGITWSSVDFITPDGSTVFGNLKDQPPGISTTISTPFRWKPNTGLTPLPKVVNGTTYNWIELGNFSDDGNTVIAWGPGGPLGTLRWTEQGGFTQISGAGGRYPRGVSSDGSTVLMIQGYDYLLWSAQSGVTPVDATPANFGSSNNTQLLSDNGKVIWSYSAGDNVYPFRTARWAEETGWMFLNPLPSGEAPSGYPAVSPDGSILFGSAWDGTGNNRAYIWDTLLGTRDLRDVLIQDYGLGGSLNGWTLIGVSLTADGRTIVGTGTNPAGKTEAFIAYLGTPIVPEPSTLLLAALALVPFAWRRRRGCDSDCPRTADIRFASLLIALLATLVTTHSAHAQPAFFRGLGFLPGYDGSSANNISANGSSIVGTLSSTGSASQSAFRWTRETGVVGLLATAAPSYPSLIALDGSTIIGYIDGSGPSPRPITPWRWTAKAGVELLPNQVAGTTYDRIIPAAVSDDGAIVMLYINGFNNVTGFNQTVRWTAAAGIEVLFEGQFSNGPAGITPDGSTVLVREHGNGTLGSFIWSADEGKTYLGTVVGLQSPPLAGGISDNGKVVLSTRAAPNLDVSYRWTQETGWVALSVLPGGAVPRDFWDLSADGSVIVGTAIGGTDNGVFIWDAINGSRNLRNELINNYGLGGSLAGWDLRSPGISADGRTIFGSGINPEGKTEAWIAFLGTPVPEPSTLLLAAVTLIPLTWRQRAVRIHANKRKGDGAV